MVSPNSTLTRRTVIRNSIVLGLVVLLALGLWGIVSQWSPWVTFGVAGITALLGAGFNLMVGLRQLGKDDRRAR